METQYILADLEETGALGVKHLKRFWSQALAQRNGVLIEQTDKSWRFDNLLLNGLGLPLEETTRYLMQMAPGFAEFENWVLARNNGQLGALQVERLNCVFSNQPYPESVRRQLVEIEAESDVLSAADLAFGMSTATLFCARPSRKSRRKPPKMPCGKPWAWTGTKPRPGTRSPLARAL